MDEIVKRHFGNVWGGGIPGTQPWPFSLGHPRGSSSARPWPNNEVLSLEFSPTRRALDDRVRGATTVLMFENDWWTFRRRPTITPCAERHDNGSQLRAHLRKEILRNLRTFGNWAHLHKTGLDEPCQARGQDIWRDAEAALELRIPTHAAKQRITDNQKTPSFADDLESARGRAVLCVVDPPEHQTNISNLLA